MSGLEGNYKGLKEIILKRTIQHFSLDPSFLETWNPTDMVLKYSPWTNMRLMLDKVAADNISGLFPTDWHPRPPPFNVQEKHFKVITEIMTEMLIQCGLLIETDIIEMTNYQNFLKVLHHHSVMGNISNTHVTHFIMLMVYMSICRLKHYTQYLEGLDGELLTASIWMTLVIMSFRTTFSMKEEHHIINPYFKKKCTCCCYQIHGARLYLPKSCTM